MPLRTGITANSVSARDIRRVISHAAGLTPGGRANILLRIVQAAKFKGNGSVAVTFCGDGAANQGTVLESLNLAAIWNLPVVFVVENNGYTESTACDYGTASNSFADRGVCFGIPGVVVDGNDFFAVDEAAGEVIRRARNCDRPFQRPVCQIRRPLYRHPAFRSRLCGRRHLRPAPDCRTDVHRLYGRVFRPNPQPSRQVPLYVRRQGRNSRGYPHHGRRRFQHGGAAQPDAHPHVYPCAWLGSGVSFQCLRC